MGKRKDTTSIMMEKQCQERYVTLNDHVVSIVWIFMPWA